MPNDTLTIYKLIILYFLDKVNFPLPNSFLSNFILGKGYTNYFNVQSALSELLDANLIDVKTTYKRSFYKLTEDGKETIDFFQNELSNEIRTDITAYLKEHKCEIIEEISIQSDYTKLKKNEYIATCSVIEHGSLMMEVHLNVTSENEAANICHNWQNKSQEVYAFLIKTLMATKSEDSPSDEEAILLDKKKKK